MSDLAKGVSDAKMLSIDEQLQQLKLEKDQIGKLFDVRINQLELQKNEQKAVQNELKAREKESSIKEDLVRSLMSEKSPTMPGTVDQLIPVEPAAQGQAIIPTRT